MGSKATEDLIILAVVGGGAYIAYTRGLLDKPLEQLKQLLKGSGGGGGGTTTTPTTPATPGAAVGVQTSRFGR